MATTTSLTWEAWLHGGPTAQPDHDSQQPASAFRAHVSLKEPIPNAPGAFSPRGTIHFYDTLAGQPISPEVVVADQNVTIKLPLQLMSVLLSAFEAGAIPSIIASPADGRNELSMTGTIGRPAKSARLSAKGRK